MGAGVQLWGWDDTNKVWVKVLVNADGKLIIDPSEIFENPPTDGETAKAPQSDWAYDHENNTVAHPTNHTPTSASDTGIKGQICWDANYIYVCVATDTWKRVAIATW